VVFPHPEAACKWRREIPVEVDGQRIVTLLDVSDRQRQHLLAGGTLNFVKNELQAREANRSCHLWT